MANKLAGQRAKFSRARAIYYTNNEEEPRQRAAHLMAQVVADAGANGFTEEEVTQGEEVPDEVRRLALGPSLDAPSHDDDAEELIQHLADAVDLADCVEVGQGAETVYAYGYRCAPDRLKIGRCAGDAVARIAAQIGTSTPDKPVLRLIVRTHDCAALERVLHGVLRLEGRRVNGAGAEWFIVGRDHIVGIHERLIESARGQSEEALGGGN